MALDCLRAERKGGRWQAARQTAAVVRPPPPPETGCLRSGHGPARPDLRRDAASNRIFSLCSED